MIRNRGQLATSAARQVALDCIEAGIRAARPERIVADAIDVNETALIVGDDEYDLDEFRKAPVIGSGNAAAHMATAFETKLRDHIDSVDTEESRPTDVAGVIVDQSTTKGQHERAIHALLECGVYPVLE